MSFPLAPGGEAAWPDIVASSTSPAANLGLVWDRYLPLWDGSRERPERKGPSLHGQLDKFARQRNNNKVSVPMDRLLAERHRRLSRAQERLAERRGVVRTELEFRLVWQFATGLGSAHPVGNGFSFDAATGTPFLSGSAVKGICRRAARLDGVAEGECGRLFGPERITAERPGWKGEVTFFDALPPSLPRLGVDIVNSHHPDYYRHSGEPPRHDRSGREIPPPPPRETDDPNPVFFLVVEKNTVFHFSFLAIRVRPESS